VQIKANTPTGMGWRPTDSAVFGDPGIEEAVKSAFGPEVRKDYDATVWPSWGTMTSPPWDKGRPDRALNVANVLANHAGPSTVTGVALSAVETGAAFVEDGNSSRRDPRQTALPANLYYRNDGLGPSTSNALRPDALLTALQAASIGIDGPTGLAKLLSDPDLASELGITRPNDLVSNVALVRTAFEYFLMNGNAEMLGAFTLGPLRAPLSWTALLGGDQLPNLRTWDDLVHAYLPVTWRDLLLAMPKLPVVLTPDPAEHGAIISDWFSRRGRPFDTADITGPSWQAKQWMGMIPGAVKADGAPASWASWPPRSFPSPKALDWDKLASAVEVIASIAISTAGSFIPGLSGIGSIMSVGQQLADLATTSEGAISEIDRWSSRLGMSLDDIARHDVNFLTSRGITA